MRIHILSWEWLCQHAVSGREIAPNTGANATKFSTLATKSWKLVAKLATRNMRVPEKIHTSTMEGISDKTTHLTGISIFQNKNKPPPLSNCQNHFKKKLCKCSKHKAAFS